MDLLELRLTPTATFPDFSGPVEVSSVLDGPEAAGAGFGGGPRVRVVDGGRVVFDQFVFESSFRGGVHVTLADVDGDGRCDLCVGAGLGGAPRVRVFRGTAAGYELAADYYAFEPSFRGGVSVAGWGTHLGVFAGPGGGPVGAIDGVTHRYGSPDDRGTTRWAMEDTDSDGMPEVFRESPGGWVEYDAGGGVRRSAPPLLAGTQFPPPTLAAVPHPSAPGNTGPTDEALARIPRWLQGYLAATGLVVRVYAGTSITELPEYAHLRGVETPVGGDGGRVYDAVPAVGPAGWVDPVVVPELSGDTTFHEVGHAVWFRLTPAARAAWDGAWRAGGWPSRYEELNDTEAFAESFRRWVQGDTGSPPAAAAFFCDLAAGLTPDRRYPLTPAPGPP